MLQRTKYLIATLACSLALHAAQEGEILSRIYVAKYLGKVSEADWAKRGSHGEIITVYNNGVTVTQNYLEGRLQGKTLRTFPHSDKVAQVKYFEENQLTRQVDYFPNGLVREEQLFNSHTPAVRTITLYREDGTMMSVETLQGQAIAEGQYFDSKGKFLSSVSKMNGERSFVDENGKLTAVEQIASGTIASRTTYYPTGSVKSRLSFRSNQIDGAVQHFLPSGAPTRLENWKMGLQNGPTLIFDNGEKFAEVPYTAGKKNGIERRFKNETTVAEEISWRDGIKHGPATIYVNGEAFTQWYYEGKKVNQMTFDLLDMTHKKKIDAKK